MYRLRNGSHDNNKQVRQAVANGNAGEDSVIARWAWSAHVTGC